MTYAELSEVQASRSRQFAEAQTNVMSVYCDAERDLKELQAENDRLRELVRDMAYCMQCERECDGCRMNGADGAVTAPAGCDGLRDRMRELGVEVER